VTLTATYVDDLSRVRLSFASAPSTADYALIERSTDQVTWNTVRGGDTVTITAGAGHLDDYEFDPGVLNYYRVSYVDSGPITYVAKGTSATGNNTSLTPGMPAGVAAGDLLILAASIRNDTGTVMTPTGWTRVNSLGNVALFARRYATGDTAPTVTFSGGVANADTLAQIAAFRNAYEVPHVVQSQLNASAQNINTPAMTVTKNNTLNIFVAWKQDDWTSVTDVLTEIQEIVSTAGDDAGMVWNYQIQTTATSWSTGAYTVTGGAAAISRVLSQAFAPAPYVARDSTTITPSMDRVWLKNPRRPNLNTKVTVTDWGTISRPARAGIFDVISRTMPVAVTDVRGSRRYELTVTTSDLGGAEELDARLAQGDPVLLHVPQGAPFPGMYAVVGDVDIDRHSKRTLRRFFKLPLTEVAAPPGTVYSQTATYADILAAYATYAAVVAAEPTYSDVLDYIAPAGDVITS
jgi:hypothetical protein